MGDEAYHTLAKVLDTLPNGFPSTDSGIEIKILKKVFTPDEAELFCDLRLTLETAEQIAERTGRTLEGLEEKLTSMWERGEIWGQDLGGVKSFKMLPWVIGIWEFQKDRMDREFCEMCEEYSVQLGPQLVGLEPHIMQVIPIEEKIPSKQEALPYEKISHIIDNSKSFMVLECVCRKENEIMDNPCDKPLEVCMALGAEPGLYDDHPWASRVLSKEEAYDVLRKAEEAGLVHLSTNVKTGHWFICNCCGCCCGVLGAINMGVPNVTNSYYYAEIDPDECDACGTCLDERCQINAIEEGDEAYRVIKERCIGCGLCISTCPSEAIKLVRKPEEEIIQPPKDEEAWFDARAKQRGVDYSAYK